MLVYCDKIISISVQQRYTEMIQIRNVNKPNMIDT